MAGKAGHLRKVLIVNALCGTLKVLKYENDHHWGGAGRI